MQPKHLLNKKGILGAIAAIWLILALAFLPGCKDNKTSQTSSRSADTSGFKMNCLVITKAQVQTWADSAGTKKLKYLLLQLHTQASGGMKLNMSAIAYPGQNQKNFGAFGSTMLNVDTSCAAVSFSAATFANNLGDLLDWGVIKPDGTLANFSKIRLIPSLKFAPMISFSVEITMDDGTVMARETNPCPPCQYCRPPECEAESLD